MIGPVSPAARGAPLEERLARLVGRPWFWAAFVAVAFAWPIVASLHARLPPPLPVLADLPPFELVDQAGRPFGSGQLEGRAWLASFVFTRCTTVCPGVTATVARIQHRTRELAPAFHLVSFSVDPAHDTPERLTAYARTHHANPRTWSFLTGPEAAVRRAVVEGLKTAMGRDPGLPGPEGIIHGSHLVLVDGRGRVRAYYDAASPEVVERVVRDAALLVNRGG
jgi:protein SCO1